MSAAITHVDVSVDRNQRSRGASALAPLLNVGFVLLGDDGSLHHATPAACQLFGSTEPDSLRTRWSAIHGTLAPALRAPGPATVTLTFDLAGETRRVRCEAHPLTEGDFVGFLVFVQSWEEVEALEGALRLASRYQTLSALHPTTAHDFKGSLNTIVLNVELLSRTIENRATTEDMTIPQHCLKTIRQELRRLEQSVGHVLDGSRVEHREAGRLHLASMLESVASMFKARADRQHVALELDVADDGIEVNAQSDEPRLAVVNLLNNALEAMPDGGTLGLGLRTDGKAAVITVSDTGPGVAPDLRHRIWELSYSTKSGGPGIGLHVVRRVAESHGGTATIDRFTPGAQFSLRLPLAH